MPTVMTMTVKRNLALILMAPLMTGATSVCAQPKDTTRVHRLPDVVVDGQQRRIDNSAPVRVIGSADYLRLGVTDVADALNRLAGVTLRDYGGAGGMKTVSVRGYGAQHTGVSYDGVMLSKIQSGEIDVSLYDQSWPAGAIFQGEVRSVGVMGDERTYENPVALRAVTSSDAMTADWAHLPYDFMAQCSNETITKGKGVNRVCYDISSKPPATPAWE